MADTEFEEFRKTFERLPSASAFKPTSSFYSIVPNIEDDSPSSKSEGSDQEDDCNKLQQQFAQKFSVNIKPFAFGNNIGNKKINSNTEDDEIGDGLRTIKSNEGSAAVDSTDSGNNGTLAVENGSSNNSSSNVSFNGGYQGTGPFIPNSTVQHNNHLERTNSLPYMQGPIERRRRKLPEIPKNKKSSILVVCGQTTSLADDLQTRQQPNAQLNQQQQQYSQQMNFNQQHQNQQQHHQHLQQQQQQHLNFHQQQHHHHQHSIISSYSSIPQRSILSYKCSYLLDEDSSPDSDRLHSLGDVDSGHSTAHSPNDFKSITPPLASTSPHSPFPPPFGGVPFSQLEMLEATHRGLHKFMPRHHDEIEVEIGDPIYVQKEADDLWCEGVNLRTGKQGIFPSAYAVDLEYNDFDPTSQKVKKERYLLRYLGSVETSAHKGTGVVCQAVRKIVGEFGDSPNGHSCILEISDQGLRMVERSVSQGKEKKKPCIDYFYSLKNVSFCAFHPRDHRYIGFITKHPTIHRFACHVFKGHESTRPVAEAVGRAFQHFYQKFIEKAYPIEDIYIE